MSQNSILIIRFSAIGDVTQCMSLPSALKQSHQFAKVDWLTRSDMAELAKLSVDVDSVIEFPRKGRFADISRFAQEIRSRNYSHIYDAHNSLRSRLILAMLRLSSPFHGIKIIRRPRKYFARFLMFWLRTAMPKQGQQYALLAPLKKWGIKSELPETPVYQQSQETTVTEFLESVKAPYVVLAPGASYKLKRWPIESFKKLTELCPETSFIALGGPDEDFLQELHANNVKVAQGTLSLKQSAQVVAAAKAVVSNDTSLLHFAEQSGIPAIALMGPAPFGYPSRSTTRILESQVPCRPCSKHGQGPCRHLKHQYCMQSLTPEKVKRELDAVL